VKQALHLIRWKMLLNEQWLLTHSCHYTPKVGWSAQWRAEIPYLFTWSGPFRLPFVPKLW
jgi:hypothetical protein